MRQLLALWKALNALLSPYTWAGSLLDQRDEISFRNGTLIVYREAYGVWKQKEG